jgi:hypothetical protein
MFTSNRSAEANVPAIILSSAVLILALAAAYYFIAVVPTTNTVTDDGSSSSSVSSMTTSSVMTNTVSSSVSSRARTAEEQAAYDGCINAATAAHNSRWAATCTTRRQNQESLYLACVNKGQTETYCKSQFPYEDIGENCTLTVAQTNTLNLQYAVAKQACGN